MSSSDLYNDFTNNPNLNKDISKSQIDNFERYVIQFETNNNNSIALNSHLLAVNLIYFGKVDRAVLFTIFDIDETEVENAISKNTYIQEHWEVSGDAYNIAIVWLSYKILNSRLSLADKQRGVLTLFKMLNYKFFTSIVLHTFKYGTNKETMEYTIANLSNKFDIIRLKTWKNVIHARALDIVNTTIHKQVLNTFKDDKAVVYILSDTNTRMKSKIKTIANEYYENYENDKIISNYGVVKHNQGEKILNAQLDNYSLMTESMLLKVQTLNQLIDNQLIRVLCSKFQYLDVSSFKRILTTFSTLANAQIENDTLYETTKVKGYGEIYTGVGSMVTILVQKFYRYCALNKIDLNNKLIMFERMYNLLSASRVSDPDILMLKQSFTYFVTECGESRRINTIKSAAIALMAYILIKSFEYI